MTMYLVELDDWTFSNLGEHPHKGEDMSANSNCATAASDTNLYDELSSLRALVCDVQLASSTLVMAVHDGPACFDEACGATPPLLAATGVLAQTEELRDRLRSIQVDLSTIRRMLAGR